MYVFLFRSDHTHCPHGFWRCTSDMNECISDERLCDGATDCPAGEDEQEAAAG